MRCPSVSDALRLLELNASGVQVKLKSGGAVLVTHCQMPTGHALLSFWCAGTDTDRVEARISTAGPEMVNGAGHTRCTMALRTQASYHENVLRITHSAYPWCQPLQA